ncbi:hypothetical protein ACFFLM_06275 [Deinococcus oregonensis]|uniref:Uncharacterized protein n=1 Tax=Deinococcus oregonensis TaxID=1805970 RepID=A0ABV6AVP7_9DEIO
MSSKPTDISRTFSAISNHRMDNIIIDRSTHTVTLSADAQGVLTATVDGVQVDVQTADGILRWARADGSVTVLETVYAVEGISMGEACNLHRVLGGFGFRGHCALTSELVGRPLSSLTELSSDEAAMVRSWAYGQYGLVG